MNRRLVPAVGKAALRWRRPVPRDERGSIIMVLFIIISASILILTVAGTAISQEGIAQRTVQRTDALNAAEAGLDAALGEIRAASSGGGVGVVQDLPCNTADGFSLTGYLDTTSSTKYTVSVTYYTGYEPTAANITSNQALTVSCYTGASPGYPDAVPYYALIAATGLDPNEGSVAAPSRTINEIYSVTDDNQDVPGGVITDFNGSFDDLCLSVSGSDTDITPASGDNLYVDTCLTAGDEDQTWEYLPNFTIVLSSTLSSPTPLCLQGNPYGGADTIRLQACLSNPSTTATPFYEQQWGIDDTGQYEPVNSSGGPYGICMNEIANSAGSVVNLAGCNGGFTATQTWQPTPAVGAGDAGAATTNQFVNYEEFGTCMDVTNQSVGSSYLIDYMCKQFPDGVTWRPQSGSNPTDPDWNQRWAEQSVTYSLSAIPSTTYDLLETNDQPQNTPNTIYCLWSPEINTHGVGGGNANPSWVTVQVCPTLSGMVPSGSTNGYANAGFLWNVNSTTTYNVMDYSGNCLNADTTDPQIPGGGSAFSTITVAGCTPNSASEEWNAPATSAAASESHLFEPNISGG